MPIVTETELRDKIRVPRLGVVLSFPPGTRFSPSAQDFIKQWRIEIRLEQPAEPSPNKGNGCSSG